MSEGRASPELPPAPGDLPVRGDHDGDRDGDRDELDDSDSERTRPYSAPAPAWWRAGSGLTDDDDATHDAVALDPPRPRDDEEPPDPFYVGAHKLDPSGGAARCRGRNIVAVLDDRRRRGSRHWDAGPLARGDGGNDGDASASASDDGDGVDDGEGAEEEAEAAASSATPSPTPPPETPSGGGVPPNPWANAAASFRPPSPPRRGPLPPPVQGGRPGPHALFSHLLDGVGLRPRGAAESPPPGGPGPAAAAADGADLSARDVPPGPAAVAREIASFAEHAAATKFRAAYLNHLNGGERPPTRPGDFRRPAPDEEEEEEEDDSNGLAGGGGRESHRRRHPALQRALPPRRPPGAPAPRRRRPAAPPSGEARPAVSTISVSPAPDGRTLASTHGDHTVKITCCHTGRLVRSLEGHPRTPWTVKHHPSNPRIVASGCLGFQVRVGDWNYQGEGRRQERRREGERRWAGRYDPHGRERRKRGRGGGGCDGWGDAGFGGSPRGVVEHPRGDLRSAGDAPAADAVPAAFDDDDYAAAALRAAGIPPGDPAWYAVENPRHDYDDGGIGICLHMIRLHSAVISLSFHPGGEVLAVASGERLHLWDYDAEGRRRRGASGGGDGAARRREADAEAPRGRTLDFVHDTPLRCVCFPPCGTLLVVGGVNHHRRNEGLPVGGGRGHRPGRGGGNGMSFHLRLWDFDVNAVLSPKVREGSQMEEDMVARVGEDGELLWVNDLLSDPLNNVRAHREFGHWPCCVWGSFSPWNCCAIKNDGKHGSETHAAHAL